MIRGNTCESAKGILVQHYATMVIDAPAISNETIQRSAHAAVHPSRNCSPLHPDCSVADRKLGLLKRTGLFGENLKGCTIQRACTADDLRQAYRLVHDVYLGQGFINPDPCRMRVRIYETTPETATFIAKVDGHVVAVLSVVEDSPELGLPSDGAFKNELDALRRAGKRLCEATNQVVAEEYRKSAVPTELMRCAVALFLTEGYDEAIAAVSPSHNGFYDLLGFRMVGPLRSYSEEIDDPVIALSMDINQYREPRSGLSGAAEFVQQFLADGNHFVSCVREWAGEARRHFLNPDLLKQLFVREKNLLAMFTPAELRVLNQRWGHQTFATVTADMFMPAYGNENEEFDDSIRTTRASSPFSTSEDPSLSVNAVMAC